MSVFIRYDSHITCCQLVSPFNIQSEFIFFFFFEEIYLTSESPGGAVYVLRLNSVCP